MGSYSLNYNWHKKFTTGNKNSRNSRINQNELYLLGLAERNKRKKELEKISTVITY